MKISSILPFIMAALLGCDNGLYSKPKTEVAVKTEQNDSNLKNQHTPADVQKKFPGFNTSEKDIVSNGNLAAAVELLGGNSGQPWDTIKKTTIESISKSPYSAMGKLYSISGKVYKVEELPPSLGLKGDWSEIIMLANNPNSALGASTIDCIYSGTVDKIKAGRTATCSGYFVGTFESQNAMGGMVESYVFVGYVKNR